MRKAGREGEERGVRWGRDEGERRGGDEGKTGWEGTDRERGGGEGKGVHPREEMDERCQWSGGLSGVCRSGGRRGKAKLKARGVEDGRERITGGG